jgi:hypothetical protein
VSTESAARFQPEVITFIGVTNLMVRHFKTEPTETVALCFAYPKTQVSFFRVVLPRNWIYWLLVSMMLLITWISWVIRSLMPGIWWIWWTLGGEFSWLFSLLCKSKRTNVVLHVSAKTSALLESTKLWIPKLWCSRNGILRLSQCFDNLESGRIWMTMQSGWRDEENRCLQESMTLG